MVDHLYKSTTVLYQKSIAIPSKMMSDFEMNLEKKSINKSKRSGGSRARRMKSSQYEVLPCRGPVKRAENSKDLLTPQQLCEILDQAYRVLSEIGIDFGNQDNHLSRLKEAGAALKNGRIFLQRDMVERAFEDVPPSFVHHGRNPDVTNPIGGDFFVFSPGSGATHISGLDEVRKPAERRDLINFIKLAHMSANIHSTGYSPCQILDMPRGVRHLEALYAHIKYSDKPFYGATASAEEAEDSIELARLIFGDGFVEKQFLMAELNTNSPLKFGAEMLDVLTIYARENQAAIISPMALMGVTTPLSISATLVQVTAEFLAGAVYAQLVRPGAPLVFGVFAAMASMQSGALSFGSQDVEKLIKCLSQIARYLQVPFRVSAGMTSSKICDSQSTSESVIGMNSSIEAGVNLVSTNVGVLDSGQALSYSKFITDNDNFARLAKSRDAEEFPIEEEIVDLLKEGSEKNSYLGSSHTEANVEKLSSGSSLADNNIYEQWKSDGATSSDDRAAEYCKFLLEKYELPALDPEIDQHLRKYIEVKSLEYSSRGKRSDVGFVEADCQSIAANHLHDNMWGDVFRKISSE